jgi:hypothetical protein
LLDEFLKEHRKVQELKKEVAALTATLERAGGATREGERPARGEHARTANSSEQSVKLPY